MTNKLITIASFRDLPEALIAKSRLESEGIESFLANEHIVGLNWTLSNALGGIKLSVLDEDARVANSILTSNQSDILDELAPCFPKPEPQDICPKCGSAEISDLSWWRKAAALSLLITFPLIFFRKRYKCKKCGHQFKP